MIQQRLGETYEEFEKRKRRVKLQSVPFGDMFAYAGGGSQVLANIIYNMDTFNVDTLLRTIDNAGSDGVASDGEMYGSNHVHLNGVDQSIDYPTVNGSDYGYFDVTTKSHIKFTASAATINITASHSNFFALGGTSITASDLTYLDANPEAVAKLVDGETVAGLSFVLADIALDGNGDMIWYPGNEGEASGAYVQAAGVALGSELSGDTGFITSAYWTQTVPANISFSASGVLFIGDCTVYRTDVLTPDKYYSIEVEIDALPTSGTIAVMAGFLNRHIITQAGTTNIVMKASAGTLDTVIGVLVESTTGAISTTVSLGSWKEVTAQEIVNFTTSSRTTLENTNYGASNLLYKQDTTGRWLSMADANLIEFTGDGRYVDTKFSMEDNLTATFEVVAMLRKTSEHKSIFGVEGRELSIWNTNFIYFKYGAEWGLSNTFTDNAFSHIIGVVENGVTVGFYINGVLATVATGSASGSTQDCLVGAKGLTPTSTIYLYKDEIGLFKVHKNKVYNQADVDKAYTEAKLKYPTLP